MTDQVLVGEACDLLLDAELHQGIRGQGAEVIQHLLLLLQILLHHLDLRVQSFQLILVLSVLGLELCLQQPDTHASHWLYKEI